MSFWVMAWSLVGCSDPAPEQNGTRDDPSPAPDLGQVEAAPQVLDFGSVPVFDQGEAVLTLTNTGSETANLYDVVATGPFEVGELTRVVVPAGASADLALRFLPTQAGVAEGTVQVITGGGTTTAALTGVGLGAHLVYDPVAIELTADLGCRESARVVVRNAGNEAAEITAFDLPEAYVWVELAPPLPWLLEPGDRDDLWVVYQPWGTRTVDTLLSASSDAALQDPAPITAWPQDHPTITDAWTQRVDMRVDVVVTLDQSPSMLGHLPQVHAAFGAFYQTLLDQGVDPQIGVIAPADGCVEGGVWVDGSMDVALAEATWSTMACADSTACPDAGLSGERAFDLLEAALAETEAGGCNHGLLRSGVDLVLVAIADEPEQSVRSWSDYVADFASYVDAPGTLTVHGIGGPYPTGCPGVRPFTGVYEASVATGGSLWSLCDPVDETLAALADALPRTLQSFPLSAQPVQSTIEVHIDGVRVVTGWTYVLADNQVVFETAPEAGAEIEITYATPGCPA